MSENQTLKLKQFDKFAMFENNDKWQNAIKRLSK